MHVPVAALTLWKLKSSADCALTKLCGIAEDGDRKQAAQIFRLWTNDRSVERINPEGCRTRKNLSENDR